MRCSCCDKELSDKEVIWNDDLQAFEMCTVCLDVALDAAYSNGFSTDDDKTYLDDGRDDDDIDVLLYGEPEDVEDE